MNSHNTGTTTRTAAVRGDCLGTESAGSFEGHVNFERRADGVYYTWHLSSPDGQFLGMRGRMVANQLLTGHADPFEFAVEHAIEGLRRLRINRRPAYRVIAWEWKP